MKQNLLTSLLLLWMIRETLAEPATNSDYWRSVNERILSEKLAHFADQIRPAKNVILFIGDGMGVTVETAARIYVGQKMKLDSDQTPLVWQEWPWVGTVKTYNVDRHTTDSASSATAYLCGIKNHYYALGVGSGVPFKDCAAQQREPSPTSIATWAQQKGKATGFVTNTRVTHATPGALYAHVADRDWEAYVPLNASDCTDIAQQLIALGGGRRNFLTNTSSTPENKRIDGQNLVEEWKNRRNGDVLYTREQLMNVDTKSDRPILGLFETNHFEYQLLAEKQGKSQPTMSEMTRVAIEKLQNNNNGKGYFLLVEAGRIDHALHDNYGKLALDETHELDKAVRTAMQLVDISDTLVIVTADHSHPMNLIGYPHRNISILGKFDPSLDFYTPNSPLTTILMFANGPQARDRQNQFPNEPKLRDLTNVDTEADTFQQPTLVPAKWDTHGGEDVAIHAIGPGAALFTGNFENTFIARAMAYVLCVGFERTACNQHEHFGPRRSEIADPHNNFGLLVFLIVLCIVCVFLLIFAIFLLFHLNKKIATNKQTNDNHQGSEMRNVQSNRVAA